MRKSEREKKRLESKKSATDDIDVLVDALEAIEQVKDTVNVVDEVVIPMDKLDLDEDEKVLYEARMEEERKEKER